MKKLLGPALLAMMLAACSSTPDEGAALDDGSGVTTVNARKALRYLDFSIGKCPPFSIANAFLQLSCHFDTGGNFKTSAKCAKRCFAVAKKTD